MQEYDVPKNAGTGQWGTDYCNKKEVLAMNAEFLVVKVTSEKNSF